jgi:2-oxoglutarate ferredoxin oxidoreductase subunit beta
MHSIHGRAPAIATGLSTSRPDLSVWVVSGDGDALSIGGNHLIHALRRNVNVKILLFNNRIYGLTKGQYSPTSEEGKLTKSTPFGSIDHPFDPLRLALGAEASFVARVIDTDKKEMAEVLRRAAAHRGAAFVEIYQNCNIFNDGAFDWVRDEKENRLYLEQGQPVGETGLVHDENDPDPARAMALTYVTMATHGKVPFGVFRDVERPVYDEQMTAQIEREQERKPGDLAALLEAGETWVVG